jgi:nucleoid DNA-binding protein
MAASTLTGSELIAELAAAHTQLRDEDVDTIVATNFDGIKLALARGDRVELRGFGAFTVRQRGPAHGTQSAQWRSGFGGGKIGSLLQGGEGTATTRGRRESRPHGPPARLSGTQAGSVTNGSVRDQDIP